MRIKSAIEGFSNKSAFYALAFVICFFPVYNSLTAFGIGLAIFSLILAFLSSLKRVSYKVTQPFLYLFLTLSVFSMVNSPDMGESLSGLRKLLTYFFLYLAIINFSQSFPRFKYCVLFLIFSAGAVSLDGIFQLSRGYDWFAKRAPMSYPHLGITRITASFHEAGSLGIFLGAVIPIALVLALFYFKGVKKFCFIGLTVLLLSVLTLTLAPGAALGFYAVLLMIAILKKNKWFVIALLLGLLVAYFFLPESLTSWPNGSFFQTIKGRILMWQVAFRIISHHPFFGAGLHTFGVNYQKFCVPGYPHCGGGTPYAHNMYVQMAAEIGLLGFFSFVVFISCIFRRLWSIYQREEEGFAKIISLGLMGSLTAYFVHGLLESSIYTSQGALLFWIIVGLATALDSLAGPDKEGIKKFYL